MAGSSYQSSQRIVLHKKLQNQLDKLNKMKMRSEMNIDTHAHPYLIHNSMLWWYCCLLLEDIILGNVDEKLLFTISEVHPYFESCYHHNVHQHDSNLDHPHCVLRDQTFYQLLSTVVKNLFCTLLVGGQNDNVILSLVLQQRQWNIYILFQSLSSMHEVESSTISL
jgi:hypothetical protein